MLSIQQYKLVGDKVEQHASPNHGGQFVNQRADSIVIHFTAGADMQSSVAHLCRKSASASAHLVIGRDGKIAQLVPFDTIAWHAGASSWQGRHGLNKYALGIELDNAGELSANEQGQFLTWFGRVLPHEQVFKGVHRHRTDSSFWHVYTEIQLQTVFDVCRLLCEEYGIDQILGHEEIAPMRKTDPGPAFPLERLRRAMSNERATEEGDECAVNESLGQVQATKLNIRSGPGSHFTPVAPPLTQGTSVKVIRQQSGWTQVEHKVTGWVSSRYINSINPHR